MARLLPLSDHNPVRIQVANLKSSPYAKRRQTIHRHPHRHHRNPLQRNRPAKLIPEIRPIARQPAYRQVFIETMPELVKALSIYERFGFHHLDRAMGNTGHNRRSLWLLKTL